MMFCPIIYVSNFFLLEIFWNVLESGVCVLCINCEIILNGI